MRIVFGAVILAVGLGAAIGAQAPAPVTIEQHEAAMKGVQQAMGAMNKNLKGAMLTEAAANAEELGKLFAQVEQFWTRNKKDDAIKLAQTARQGAMAVATAAKAGDAAGAQMAAQNVQGTCKQCHGMYREGNPQEGFRLKADAGVN
jgi:cytochrome c556